MRYAKLGKISSTVSLMALLAAAGMSSAQAASPTLAGVGSTMSVASSAKMTPHVFENSIITDPPLPPGESGLCGQAGLEPVFQDTSALHYHYEVRNNVITAVADPGSEFADTITLEQRTFLFNPAYYSCPEDTNVPNPSIWITQIDAPHFGRVCDPADKQVVLPSTEDKLYYYLIQDGEVIATEKDTNHIIQQDTIRRWPIVLSSESCDEVTVIQPPAPSGEQTDAVASEPQAEAQVDVSAAPVALSAAPAVETAAPVTAVVAPPAQLAVTGGMDWFAFGVSLIVLSIGTALYLWSIGYFNGRGVANR
jgi:hypothetical protein